MVAISSYNDFQRAISNIPQLRISCTNSNDMSLLETDVSVIILLLIIRTCYT